VDLTAVGLHHHALGRPQEVDLVADEQRVELRPGQTVGRAELQEAPLELVARLVVSDLLPAQRRADAASAGAARLCRADLEERAEIEES